MEVEVELEVKAEVEVARQRVGARVGALGPGEQREEREGPHLRRLAVHQASNESCVGLKKDPEGQVRVRLSTCEVR